jgi:hypothetical protein
MLSILTPDLQKRYMPDLATLEGQAAVAEIMPAKTELVMVDSLSSLARGDRKENDAESWVPIADWALAQRVAGRSVLFFHHANKRGEQRGTSKREDLLETVLVLRSPANCEPHKGAKFEVHIEKSRGLCSEFQAIEAELTAPQGGTGVVWSFKPLEQTRAQKIRRLHADGMSKNEIAEELHIDRSTVYRELKRQSASDSAGAK